MPAELRNVARTIARMKDASEAERAAAKEQLNAQAAAWRRANCWSPNQLRHAAATRLEAEYDLQTAACILGHSDPSTTRIYAERDFGRAAAIMAEIG